MHSAIDPMGQVYTAGHAYRQATGKPVNLIIVLGVWLIFAPQLVPLVFITLGITQSLVQSSAGLDYSGFNTYDFFSGLLGILITLGMSVVSFLIIFKTTRGYIHTRRRERGLCVQCKYDLRGSMGQPRCPECGSEIDWFEDDDEYVEQNAIETQD